MVPLSKSGLPKGNVGSNPTLSATAFPPVPARWPDQPSHPRGEVLEWSNRHDWKSCIPQGIVGSNPTLSASNFLLRFGLFPRKLTVRALRLKRIHWAFPRRSTAFTLRCRRAPLWTFFGVTSR